MIDNIETCGREIRLIEFELPQPPSIKTPLEQQQQQQHIPTDKTLDTQSVDRKVISDVTGWLRLKDDKSGKCFYFKDGEYAWGE